MEPCYRGLLKGEPGVYEGKWRFIRGKGQGDDDISDGDDVEDDENVDAGGSHGDGGDGEDSELRG